MQILLWNDQQRDQIKTLLGKVKTLSPMPFGIQLAHAGRKASTEKPWLGKIPNCKRSATWLANSCSKYKYFSVHDAAPHALTIAEIKQIQQDFAAAVNVQLKRALS